MYGLTFNQKHSFSDLGLIMLSKNRAVLPSAKDEYVEIPGKDGSYLFPGSFTDRVIEVEFAMPAVSLENLRQRARQVAAWLYSKNRVQLIFDDEPELFYLAKIANQIDLEQVAIAIGRFTVQFRCEPLAYSVAESTVNNPATVAYNGTYFGLPVITLTATAAVTNPSITVNGETLAYTGNLTTGQSLIINSSTYQVTKAGANALGNISGDFPVLNPGNNVVSYSAGCNLQVSFKERWL